MQPSHVDVRTQGQYQAMDPAFLGLIFSCFPVDAPTQQTEQRIAVTAFQVCKRGGGEGFVYVEGLSTTECCRGRRRC